MSNKKPGVDDPYDWIGWWSDLHHSESFFPDLTRHALEALEDPFAEGPDSRTWSVDDGDGRVDVKVEYLLEQFPGGRILHVVSIRSNGDPLPPFV